MNDYEFTVIEERDEDGRYIASLSRLTGIVTRKAR